MNWVDVEFGYEEGYRQGKLESYSSVSLIGILFDLLGNVVILGMKLLWHMLIILFQIIFFIFRIWRHKR